MKDEFYQVIQNCVVVMAITIIVIYAFWCWSEARWAAQGFVWVPATSAITTPGIPGHWVKYGEVPK